MQQKQKKQNHEHCTHEQDMSTLQNRMSQTGRKASTSKIQHQTPIRNQKHNNHAKTCGKSARALRAQHLGIEKIEIWTTKSLLMISTRRRQQNQAKSSTAPIHFVSWIFSAPNHWCNSCWWAEGTEKIPGARNWVNRQLAETERALAHNIANHQFEPLHPNFVHANLDLFKPQSKKCEQQVQHLVDLGCVCPLQLFN